MKKHLLVIFMSCSFIGIAQDTTIMLSKSMFNEQDKIFQPFFTTKPTGEGTGLGLSSSYDIVKAHGGELKLESQETNGSTFSIILPIQSKS